MDGLLRLLRQAKWRMLSSTRAAYWSESYNMSLLPDSSRESVLLRNARMGNNVLKSKFAQDRVCTVGTGYSGTRRLCPTGAGTSTQYPGKICITFGDKVPLRHFHAALICPWTNAHPYIIFVVRAGREAKSSDLRV
jgi:hypothetical protein